VENWLPKRFPVAARAVRARRFTLSLLMAAVSFAESDTKRINGRQVIE
jgi:hypothetical protein